MNTKVYFENLPDGVTEKELMEMFSAHGNVVDIHIMVDRTGRESHSHGFVTMITPEGARAAIQSINGRVFGTATLCLSEMAVGSQNGRPVPRRMMRSLY